MDNRKQVTVYIEKPLYKRLKIQSAVTGEEMSIITGKALEQYLSRIAAMEAKNGN